MYPGDYLFRLLAQVPGYNALSIGETDHVKQCAEVFMMPIAVLLLERSMPRSCSRSVSFCSAGAAL